ncbi:MAG: HDOD domain-containing protein [Planctomycetaceae bacterium]
MSVFNPGDSLPVERPIKLPTLPLAVVEFMRSADSPDANAEDLAAIVETDTGMTCGLLRYVNSSAVGLRSQVGSVQHAISVLGIQRTSLFLITSAIENGVQPVECRLLDLEQFAHSNLERALFAREMAGQIGGDSQLAFTGAMLQDFLLPYLMNQSQTQYLGYRDRDCRETGDLVQFEYAENLRNHAQEAARWMVAWDIPDELVCCVLMHHQGLAITRHPQLCGSSVAAVALSALLPDPVRQVPGGLAALREWQNAAGQFNLSDVCQRVDQQFRSLRPAGRGYQTVWQRCAMGEISWMV